MGLSYFKKGRPYSFVIVTDNYVRDYPLGWGRGMIFLKKIIMVKQMTKKYILKPVCPMPLIYNVSVEYRKLI